MTLLLVIWLLQDFVQLLLMGKQTAEETWENIAAEHGEVYE